MAGSCLLDATFEYAHEDLATISLTVPRKCLLGYLTFSLHLLLDSDCTHREGEVQ